MAQVETPQQALREIRIYIDKYIESLSRSRLATELSSYSRRSISESTVRMIEDGERELQPYQVDALLDFLCNRPTPLIAPQKRREFKSDLLHGISVTRYLVDYVNVRRRRATIPSPIQQAMLITAPDDLPLAISKDYPIPFVGRQQLIQEIYARLDKFHRVLISHFAGTGKTALAAKVCEHHLKTHAKPDVIWLRAGTGSIEEIEQAFLDLLDPGRKKGERLLKLLRDSSVGLIVLDDLWQDNLTDLRLPYEVNLLVTSRRHVYFENQQVFALEELDDGEALDLLIASIPQETDLDIDAAKRLCQQLGKHPLALKIAGASMSRGGRTPDEIVANLGDYVIYNEKSAARTLDALIRQSFEAPGIRVRTEDIEAVFCMVGSLFASIIPEDLLFDTLLPYNQTNNECLATLIDLCLITRDTRQQVYAMHDLVYACAELYASREIREQGLAACVNYIREYAQNYDAIYLITYNLLGLIQSYRAKPDLVHASVLLDFLYPLVETNYFDARGYRSEFVNALVDTAQFAEAQGEYRKAHYLWAKAGNGFTEFLREYDRASFAYSEAGRLAARAQEAGQESYAGEAQYRHALSFSLVGKVCVQKRDLERAKDYLAQAVAIAKQPYNPAAVSQIYEHGVFLAGEGLNDIALAREYARLSLEHAEHISDEKLKQERRFFITMNMAQIERVDADAADETGNTALATAKRQMAQAHYADAEQIALSEDNDDWRGRLAQEYGEVLFELGNAPEAIQRLKTAEELFIKINSPRVEEVQNLILWIIIYKSIIEVR